MEVRRKNFHMGMKKQAPNTRRQNEVSNGQGQQHPRSRQRKQISFKSFNSNNFQQQRNNNNEFHCTKCGTIHFRGNCKAFGKICRKCGLYNHFVSFCKSKSVNNIARKEELYIGSVENSTSSTKSNWTVDLKINNEIVNFKVDTGADVNVIPFSLYNAVFKSELIMRDDTKLIEYTGNQIEIIGYITAPVFYKNNEFNVKFFIAKGYGRPIIGKTSIEDLDIARMVAEMSDTKRYMLDFHDVFDGIGCLPGQYRIKVDETVKPCIHAARRFPQGILEN
ncbi:uncharacterized protein LOC123310198 [Coccinella septempunctata]|uniref:uncharacterized protein LOC123310198 n=1 Tax=Coccinella septempunctata TaxID=41139 RepID=UPI001D095F21|nr:uncharacterized protein LOC123310198 [Coccinella septempunctata]